MAAAPVCFKMFYKDRIINIDQEVSIHRVRYTYVSYKSANRLRYVSANASEREKRSTFISRSSSKEKQLKSLDSYFGKSKEDNNNNNQYSPNSLNNDLITSTPNKEQITNPKKYLIKNEQAEVDDHRGLKSEYDESSGLYIISTMASINIAVYLFEIASPITNSDMELFSLPALYGAKINHLIVYGEWWRLLTPMFLHTGILHIGLDCWALLTFGPRVCRAYGPFTFLLIYILGGLSGNLTSFLHTPDPTVGGTGPVFGIIGAWLIYQYQNKEAMGKDDFESMYQKAIVATALGFVLSTFGPIDDWTHFGSAFTGIAYGYLTCPTLQIDNSSSSTVESGKENGITLIQRNVNPCKSLVIFSIFISVLCCLFLIFEPPLGSLVVDTLV